ncbi:MAG: hypothetical protein HPY51_19720 [Candidatus Omnitrophica bacterium]|nr:hypothetical protein [Candidatus Omnitrophota bacterium]
MCQYFPADEDAPLATGLKNPCSLEWYTGIGRITLLVDQANPVYLFISIEGEPRKCVDLAPFHLTFADRQETLDFLEQLRDSEFMSEILQEEESMQNGWDAL